MRREGGKEGGRGDEWINAHSGVARLSAAMSHRQTLDYCAAAVAPRWSDTLNFLAHGEKGSEMKAGEGGGTQGDFFLSPPTPVFVLLSFE